MVIKQTTQFPIWDLVNRYNSTYNFCFSSECTVIAFAMYYFTYDPWIGKILYLEDFYVMEDFRGEFQNAGHFLI